MFRVKGFVVHVVLPALLIVAVAAPPWAAVLPAAHAAVYPALPQVFLDTTYALPTGSTITVPAGGDFQTALNAAQPGSIIVLAAGATYSGNFTLPNKSGTGWIYIQSSALGSLPSPGTRVTPARASLMPKIVSSNMNPAIQTASAAHHYRFVGIEIATTWATTSSTAYAVVNLDGAPAPSNLTFDRCYIHGTSTGNLRNGLIINSASTAILDSWISDVHEMSNESHGILGNSGPGPFKIANNEVQASGVNIMFSQDSSNGTVPSDIEIRGNHLFKLTTWYYPNNSSAGIATWSVKNLFELKNAARVLVDGNVLENAWNDYFQSNSGAGITLTPRAGNCGCSWHVVKDVAITHNIIKNTTSGFTNMGTDNSGTTEPLQRVLLKDNLFVNIGAYPDVAWGMQGMFHYTSTPSGSGFSDVTIDHNTVLVSHVNAFYNMYIFGGGGASFQNFVFTNNIAASGGGLNGNTLNTLNSYYPGYIFTKNAMVGGTDNPYPGGDFFPSSYDPGVGFVSYARGDYHLSAPSPYKNAGTDGKDLGADVDAVLAATASAIGGAPFASSDTTPPTVAITAPAPGASVAGTVTVAAAASDNVGVSGVQLKLDGMNLGAEDIAAPYAVSWNTATAVNGSHILTAVARDAAGNTAASTAVGVTVANVDTTPPLFSSITVSSIGPNSTAITWTTNEPSDSQVEYGLTTAYGSLTALGPPLVTAHSQTLTGLAPATFYHYRVRSRDGAGNLAVSADFTLTTASAASVSVSPTSLSFGSVTVGSSSAAQDVQITNTGSVGVSVSSLTTTGPFTISQNYCQSNGGWNGVMAPGTHCDVLVSFAPVAGGSATGTLSIIAATRASAVSFTGTGVVPADTTLPSTPTGLTATAVSSSQVTLTWSPSTDNVGVAGYKVFQNGTQIATVSTSGYQDAGRSPATTYTYTVAAYDAAGNASAQSSPASATTLSAVSQSPYGGMPWAMPGIVPAENFDNGSNGVAYYDATPGNQGGQYRLDVDVDIMAGNGGYVIGAFQTGEWLAYTINISAAGTYRIEALVSSELSTSRFHIEIDGVNTTGSVSVPNTGSWNTFNWIGKGGVNLTAGLHTLRIYAEQQYFNLDAIRVRKGP